MQLSHEKYIKKKDDNKYDVTLNVSSKKGTKTSKKKLDILLIVDRSGSMDDEDRMENAKLAVNNLCDSYLVSLPTNNYYSGNGASDDWIYDLTKEHNSAVGLKPEQHVRYGNLVINKELVDHNATFGNNATFVFQIDITTLDKKKETRIEELTFSAAGSHSVTIEKIPAGSHVKVTEVYSGASYELASAKSQETDIIANPEKETEVEFRPAEVSFINKHDGRTNGGYGVKNNFKLDENGQYQYTKPAAKN